MKLPKIRYVVGMLSALVIISSVQAMVQPATLDKWEKEFIVETKYLIMPIHNKGKGSTIKLYIDGKAVRQYSLNLAHSAEQTDWYAFFTLGNYKGKKARIEALTTKAGFSLIKQSDTIPSAENFYKEPHRPQFHFSQKVGWNNDPNGMVYHNGTWHLFFQHNPVGLPWGNMTWGHAISKDLLHWEQQPEKLFPKTMCKGAAFSGSAIVDKKNTAGWGENTLVAFLTDTGCGECIAYSTDNGETFTYYKKNPVVRHNGRDPKVSWYAYDKDDKPLDDKAKELGGHWVMVVYDVQPQKEVGRNAAFYTSTNLKDWTKQSHLPGYYECTDLFELPVGGDAKDTRWVVFAADARYAVGTFDGRTFTPEHQGKHQLHYGPYYASQTFDNTPDGRRIQIGWIKVAAPGPYNQHFSFPHCLTLRKTEEGLRMFATPVKEIETLRAKSNTAKPQKLKAGKPVDLPVGSDLLDIRLAVEVGNAETIELNVPGGTITYDVKAGKLNQAEMKPVAGKITLQVLVDRSLMEIVGNAGRVYISGAGPGKKMDASKISVTATGGDARLVQFEAYELKSIWTTAISKTKAAAKKPAGVADKTPVISTSGDAKVVPIKTDKTKPIGTTVYGKTNDLPKELTVDVDGGVKLELVLIPPGSFMISGEGGGEIHKVNITKPFYLGKHEVTQEQWEKVMGGNPSQVKGGKKPVENVSWDDCREFLDKLNAKAGRQGWKFVLPTDAQWEYACRAGSTTKYCFGDDPGTLGEYAWYIANSQWKTHPVGEKKPNAWGLYDMHGNVWEWCQDWQRPYTAAEVTDPRGPATGWSRVYRGGCFAHQPDGVFSFSRESEAPEMKNMAIGFRVSALEVIPLTAAAPAKIGASELKCEYAVDPLGLEVAQPRFGWVLQSDKRGQAQTAYQILVAGSEAKLEADSGDKWDSGKVNSDRSLNVEYQGKQLASAEKCYWKVRVWDKQGKPSTWSQPGNFEMGLMKQSDWKGHWIGVTPPNMPSEHLEDEKPGRINVALAAKPSTSFVSGHEMLDAINDGIKPTSSNDRHYGTYGNWPHTGVQWVQYEWSKPVNIDTIDVYWFDDTAGVRLPKAARLLYWDGKTFVPVKNLVGLGLEGNKYNTTTFAEITTSKLKLEFDSIATASTGILEFKVYDAGKSPKFPPTTKINRFFAMAEAVNAPAPLLRKEFNLTKSVQQARVRFSGLGWSELYINGKKVSDDVLSPGLTDYSQEVLYRTYDVTSFLKPGHNAIGIMLGNGWYSASSILPWEKGGPWGYWPRAILQLTLTHDDGTQTQLLTDKTWKTARGAIGSNQLVAGEEYDARLEKPNWNKAGYDDSQWSNVALLPAPAGRLRNQSVPSMKVQDTFRPIKITEQKNGDWLFEFDHYFSGWVLLKTKGKAGNRITINYEVGEKDTYILKGNPKGETYEPRFTIHPVRYVRIEGLEGKPAADAVLGREVYSDVDMYGRFTCSNNLINQIHGIAQRSLKVALKGFMLDCLHREPIFYNEPASYFGSLAARKYTPALWTEVARSIPLAGSDNGDLSDIVPRLPGMNRESDVSQNAAYPMLIWYLYQAYGDKRLIEQHCDRVKAWVDFIGRDMAGDNHIVTAGWLGEHMLPGREVGHWEFISAETPKDFIWTCLYYHNTRTLANMFQVLGKKKQEKRYGKLAQEINSVINKTWLDSKTGHYATTSQTSEILALALDIVPQENRKQLIENIAKTITQSDGGKLRVGHIGLPGFMESLVANGLGEIVYAAVNHIEFPGWGYMIDQGATTVWESWGMLKGGYHAEESMTMLAGVGRLFYESIAGIQEPPYYGDGRLGGSREFGLGYSRYHIRPHALGDLEYAAASIKTVRGIISSSWKRTKDSFVLEVAIPVNSTAKVSLPTLGLKKFVVIVDGQTIWKNDLYIDGVAGITDARQNTEWVTFDVGSGSYRFELKGK